MVNYCGFWKWYEECSLALRTSVFCCSCCCCCCRICCSRRVTARCVRATRVVTPVGTQKIRFHEDPNPPILTIVDGGFNDRCPIDHLLHTEDDPIIVMILTKILLFTRTGQGRTVCWLVFAVFSTVQHLLFSKQRKKKKHRGKQP